MLVSINSNVTSYEVFDIGKTNSNFKTRYKEYIFKIKLKKTNTNSNFLRFNCKINYTT